MRTNVLITSMFLLLSIGFIQAKPQFGRAQLFNMNWMFKLSDIQDGASSGLDDSKWRKINLPHDWSVEGTYSPDKASATGYLPGGIAWYRKKFSVPQTESGNRVYIYFEGVYNHSEVFINGNSVGKRPNGYISFMYDLTPFVRYGAENVLSVRVDHSLDADSRWYSGSGIYRDAYLVYSSQVHLDLWGIYAKTLSMDSDKAEISVETSVSNSLDRIENVKISHELLDPASGKIVARVSRVLKIEANQKGTIEQSFPVKSPKLWSLEKPELYTLRTTLTQKEKILDQNEQKVGIRELRFDPDKGLSLNGNSLKTKGVCIHHDAGCLGSAVPPEVWRRRLNTLKEMGCNGIRMTHNPQAPVLYDLCDELGFLVMDEAFDEWEFAKKKWLKGWNKGVPGYQGAASYFNEWSDQDLKDMVLRDRNHPSVMLWSIGNEVDYPNDPYTHPILDHANFNQPVHGGYLPNNPKAERLGDIAKRLAAVVRKYDNSRPVTAGLAGVVMSNETKYPDALDVTGYNYTEDRYAQDHKKYPKRVLFGSENGHSMEAWKVVRDTEYIFGQFIWTGIDYLGESGAWPSRGFYSGFLDFGGFLKPRGYFRQSLWSTKPVIYAGTYPQPLQKSFLSTDAWPIWNYRDNEMIRVVCYTNSANAKLMLNGKQAGETKKQDDKTGVIFWDIPFEEGKLEVVGFDLNSQEECRYTIQSSGRPFAITAKSDCDQIVKNQGLAHVVIQIVDEKGIPVMISEDEITCTVNGPANLLGLEASNNTDMGDYSDNRQRVFHGRLLAYIQASGETGQINLTFSAPWLKEAKVTFDAVDKVAINH
jgi:beta-galactosidase/beta-glucuronidase